MSLGTQEQRIEGMKRQAQELIDQAYHRGFKAEKEERSKWEKEQRDRLIEQGRNEAWEAANKIMQMSVAEKVTIFANIGRRATYSAILELSASEAIERVREWEEKKKQEQDKFHVGDIIQAIEHKAVVTWCDGEHWNGVCLSGSDKGFDEVGMTYSCMRYEGWTKTGKTIAKIEEVLEELKEDEK